MQGYLPGDGLTTVRIRIAGDAAWLTIKGPTSGASRLEFEYPLPLDDAEQMLGELCGSEVIDKTRYKISHAGHIWEVDLFHGDNRGLVLAEVELDSESEAVELPPWVTREVTGDPRYYNVNLLRQPYSLWAEVSD